MLMKNAWMLLINWFRVPRAPLIARSAGPIVLAIALPMLLIAATMAAPVDPELRPHRLGCDQRHDQHQDQELRPVFP